MPNKEFNSIHLAFKAAIGDYINEPNMSLVEIVYALERAGAGLPPLEVIAEYETIPANQLHDLIRARVRSYGDLMKKAYKAGSNGEEYL